MVDNRSVDGSLEYLLPKFPWVNFIGSPSNVGFAKANNIALQQCKGDYVLYLNPDTIIPENSLQDCLDFLSSNKTVGAAGVRMIDGSGNFCPRVREPFHLRLYRFIN